MAVAEIVADSSYQLLQTESLPPDSWCRMSFDTGTRWLSGYWHVWHAGDRFCAYHNGIKAPAARVTLTRRENERRVRRLVSEGR